MEVAYAIVIAHSEYFLYHQFFQVYSLFHINCIFRLSPLPSSIFQEQLVHFASLSKSDVINFCLQMHLYNCVVKRIDMIFKFEGVLSFCRFSDNGVVNFRALIRSALHFL